jgi:hypothetical protein
MYLFQMVLRDPPIRKPKGHHEFPTITLTFNAPMGGS